MPRKARIRAPGQYYSVVTRVNNSEHFFTDEQIAQGFIDHLKVVKKKLNFKLYAFVIMSSHVHLLIKPDDETADISQVMQKINGSFAVTYNKTFKKKGHFWMERFKSKIVQDIKHIANTIIYFALNPVRAGITDNPLKYKFSSVHNIVSKQFTDLIDPLPEEFNDLIKEFLQRENFLEFIEKLSKKISAIYSFNLKKTQQDQRYRHFCGGYAFIKKQLKKLNFSNI